MKNTSPLLTQDIESWADASKGWPEICSAEAEEMYVFAKRSADVPYGAYVLLTNKRLRVHPAYIAILRTKFDAEKLWKNSPLLKVPHDTECVATPIELDLGANDILVIEFPQTFSHDQRQKMREYVARIINSPGRKMLVVEGGAVVKVIYRGEMP